MLVPFLIMLREGIEAALIVGIIASYLTRSGGRQWLPTLWIGVFLAIALSFAIGTALLLATAQFPQKAQELFEAAVGLIASLILVSMVFWMRAASRTMKSSLQGAVDSALSEPDSWRGLALASMAFFAVAREGLESVFFLLAVFEQSESPSAPLGALLGLLTAVVIGYGIYAGGIRINLRRFFHWTAVFIIFVAAGLLAGSLRHLHEAGLWNHLQSTVFDLSRVLPADSLLGSLLAGIFGYIDAPNLGEVTVYVAFLAIALTAFFWPSDGRTGRAVLQKAGVSQ